MNDASLNSLIEQLVAFDDAWEEEITILKDQLRDITGNIFNIPVGKTLPNQAVQ